MISICEKCENMPATETHHLFPNTSANRRRYGKLINHKLNKQRLCYGCHHGHNGEIKHLSEIEFCNLLKIPPEGKTEQFKLSLGKR